MGAVGTSGRQQVGWWQLWGGVVHGYKIGSGDGRFVVRT